MSICRYLGISGELPPDKKAQYECLLQLTLELLVIGLPEEDLPPFITTRRYVVERSLIFDTQPSSHNHPTLSAA
jgi:hypothetical protein